jgi:hypothetical protein
LGDTAKLTWCRNRLNSNKGTKSEFGRLSRPFFAKVSGVLWVKKPALDWKGPIRLRRVLIRTKAKAPADREVRFWGSSSNADHGPTPGVRANAASSSCSLSSRTTWRRPSLGRQHPARPALSSIKPIRAPPTMHLPPPRPGTLRTDRHRSCINFTPACSCCATPVREGTWPTPRLTSRVR